MYTASCHCGAIKIEIDEKPQSLTECTCSICHRLGARWAYYTRQQVRVMGLAGSGSVYLWGDKCIEFYHCKNCGCATHYESVGKDDDSRIAVNARMLRPEDITGIPLRTFDGADTWEFLD
jgi:hypothetical protein